MSSTMSDFKKNYSVPPRNKTIQEEPSPDDDFDSSNPPPLSEMDVASEGDFEMIQFFSKAVKLNINNLIHKCERSIQYSDKDLHFGDDIEAEQKAKDYDDLRSSLTLKR
mmetsp:Transcript_10845/g.16472  ORF Transcript_10845/g.16472 Transcript_10845/m.16472 type:complete len:109 (-) Transcript_10845:693-1019(-)